MKYLSRKDFSLLLYNIESSNNEYIGRKNKGTQKVYMLNNKHAKMKHYPTKQTKKEKNKEVKRSKN